MESIFNFWKKPSKDEERRPSSATELEGLRAKKRFILDCLDAAGVPLDEQDRTCKVLVDAGITNEERLLGCTAETLTNLGIKPEVRDVIIQGKDKIKTRSVRKSTAGKRGSATAGSNSRPTQSTTMQNGQQRRSVSGSGGGGGGGRGSGGVATKFSKGDPVEHYRESDQLVRKGKVVGVHLDDMVNGVYYTVLMDQSDGREVQSAERKLEAPGVWEKLLREKGIEPFFTEEDAAKAAEQREAEQSNNELDDSML